MLDAHISPSLVEVIGTKKCQDYGIQNTDEKPVSIEHHPELYKDYMDLCRSARIANSVPLFIIRAPEKMPNAALITDGTGTPKCILLDERYMQSSGPVKTHAMIARQVAVLGHELGHQLHSRRDTVILTEIMPKTVALLTQAAYAVSVYQNAKKTKEEGQPKPPLREMAKKTAATLLKSELLAIAAGMVTKKIGFRIREFDADDTAVELTGDPDAVALMLRDLERFEQEYKDKLPPSGKAKHLIASLFGYPSTDKRATRIEAKSPYNWVKSDNGYGL